MDALEKGRECSAAANGDLCRTSTACSAVDVHVTALQYQCLQPRRAQIGLQLHVQMQAYNEAAV